MKKCKKTIAGILTLSAIVLWWVGCSNSFEDENRSEYANYGQPVEIVPDGFKKISRGTFQREINYRNLRNKPVQTVNISKDFYICDHEVTQAEYLSIMKNNPSYFNGKTQAPAAGEVQENRPVETVSWYMAIVYCNERSKAENLTPCYSIVVDGKDETDTSKWGSIPASINPTWDAVKCNWDVDGYRLPTEAEWEYAARAGAMDRLIWSGTKSASSLKDYAWYSDNSGSMTHEVKKTADTEGNTNSNAFGLYDMSGNVWEWCWDLCSGRGVYFGSCVTDPHGDSKGLYRVRRGGGCNSFADDCAVSYPDHRTPDTQSNYIGFRVCRSRG